MSDGGISNAPAQGANAAPDGETQYDASGNMTEAGARAVLTGLVDERLNTRFAEPEGLGRIHERMDEISQQQRQFMDSLSEQGLYPEAESESDDEYEPDFLDALDQDIQASVDRRFDAQEAAEEAELMEAERDYDFEALRERLPLLQNDQTALEIVHRAADLCHAWDQPELIGTPDFVTVIEQVALASYADPGLLGQVAAAHPAPDNGAASVRPVVLESAAGAGRPQDRPRTEQDRFIDYIQATQKERI